jgi:hypothetical protein
VVWDTGKAQAAVAAASDKVAAVKIGLIIQRFLFLVVSGTVPRKSVHSAKQATDHLSQLTPHEQPSNPNASNIAGAGKRRSWRATQEVEMPRSAAWGETA